MNERYCDGGESIVERIFPFETAQEVLSIGGYGKLTRKELKTFLKEQFPSLSKEEAKKLVNEFAGGRKHARR